MKKSFEERLLEISGEAELKAAKAMLKNGRLIGVWRDREGRLCGRFHLNESVVETCVRTGEHPAGSCNCATVTPGRLCEHAVALILYAGRYNFSGKTAVQEEAPAYYGGLKQESLPKLLERARPPQAELYIDAVSAFPHVPSKWENATLAIKLKTAGRDYIGNLNNLRQLYFDKSLTVSLKLDHFSLHEQQIIRFLAINGEAENSQILLNSEMTAEFFHSLVNFPRFTRNGRKLHVRGGFAEAVLLISNAGSKSVMSPGIRVNGAILPIASAKVITGRSGCWIGREGEYFFVGATCEISWLRNFFRVGVQAPPAGVKLEEFLSDFPLPVVCADGIELDNRTLEILLDGEISHSGEFMLSLRYLYDSDGLQVCLRPESGRLVRENDHFWRRDENGELAFENELSMFGFVKSNENYLLSGVEQIGTFLDRALPEFLAVRDNLALSGRLAGMLRGNTGVPELEFNCRMSAKLADGWLIEYTLKSANVIADWKSCLSAAKSGSGFLALPGVGIVKLSSAQQRFFLAASGVVRKLDPVGRTFEIASFAAEYFTFLVRDIPGAIVPELTGNEVGEQIAVYDLQPDYQFAGELRKYQQEGVRFLQYMTDRNYNVILADEMGLGKTVQLLALLASRKKRGMAPALIVCPASLIDNWAREAARFVPEFKIAAPHDGVERGAIWKSLTNFDLVILSYAAARLSIDKLKHYSFSFLVLDEAQHIKNPGSSNAKNCKSIDAVHRIVLTGTPLENSPEDLWSIFDFLQPGMLGTLAAFRRYYADIKSDSALQRDLAARIAPFVKRRTKAMVAPDLPPKFEHTIYCEMDSKQRRLYDEVLAKGRNALRSLKQGDTRGNATIFSTLLRLRQICCHPALLPDDEGKGVPSAKMELLLELLHEHFDSNHKVLLFSQFTSLLALAIPELKQSGIAFEYLDGATRNRQQRVDHFNHDPAIPLFLLSLKAGGTGLNLTGADTVIIYDPWWNPAVELQAADRTHRIGQTRPVNSLKLVVKDSIEEKILELQSKKQEIFDSVVDSPEAIAGAFSMEELRFLLDA
ncbi:MAG: DEAD/DEAH box helicase [Victivallales bacterium]|jgi:superfamily II DNA or RNA helicase|nr:DEAD/DEAH box helicase [Victivallales bacterium]